MLVLMVGVLVIVVVVVVVIVDCVMVLNILFVKMDFVPGSCSFCGFASHVLCPNCMT